MQANIPIIIIAYNRPHALKRLLGSLQKANYTGYNNISLLISIDFSGNAECVNIARDFSWVYGEKKIIEHQFNLGLREHVMSCGDISKNFDGVIILEDDLYVSPAFYDYAQQAYRFYKDDAWIAGMALYSNRFNEVAFCPFEPIADGYDNYFMQVPCSWGQIWTKNQWSKFKEFLIGYEINPVIDQLPPSVLLWPTETSWKKAFYAYMIKTNRYFVYPGIGLTTNCGEMGMHHDRIMNVWQTSLLLKTKQFHFSTLVDSISVYDAFYELDAAKLGVLERFDEEITVDINGAKPLGKVRTRFLLSTKYCVKPLQKFPMSFYPYENNLLLQQQDGRLEQDFISYGETTNFRDHLAVDRKNVDVQRIFFNENQLTHSGRTEVYASKEYILGKKILKPVRFIKRFLNRK